MSGSGVPHPYKQHFFVLAMCPNTLTSLANVLPAPTARTSETVTRLRLLTSSPRLRECQAINPAREGSYPHSHAASLFILRCRAAAHCASTSVLSQTSFGVLLRRAWPASTPPRQLGCCSLILLDHHSACATARRSEGVLRPRRFMSSHQPPCWSGN